MADNPLAIFAKDFAEQNKSKKTFRTQRNKPSNQNIHESVVQRGGVQHKAVQHRAVASGPVMFAQPQATNVFGSFGPSRDKGPILVGPSVGVKKASATESVPIRNLRVSGERKEYKARTLRADHVNMWRSFNVRENKSIFEVMTEMIRILKSEKPLSEQCTNFYEDPSTARIEVTFTSQIYNESATPFIAVYTVDNKDLNVEVTRGSGDSSAFSEFRDMFLRKCNESGLIGDTFICYEETENTRFGDLPTILDGMSASQSDTQTDSDDCDYDENYNYTY